MWELLITLSLIVGAIIGIREHYVNQPGTCSSVVQLTGKTAVVTGAASGVGMETARGLAERGARVILASENLKRGHKVANNIIKATGNTEVYARYLDTSDLTSVRNFARDLLKTEDALHILVNCANMRGPREKIVTADGLEITMATNYFGHFLLTSILLGLLQTSAPSRVVTLTSEGHRFCKDIDLEDLNYEKRPFKGPFDAYGQSRLCNNLFTLELARKLQGTGVTANCVHPGTADHEVFSKVVKKNVHSITAFILKSICKDEKVESRALDYLAVSEEVKNHSGDYFVAFKVSEPSRLSREQDLAKKIWEASEILVRLSPEEKHYDTKL